MSLTPRVLSSLMAAFKIGATLSFIGLSHLQPTWKPKYSISSRINSHFSNFTRIFHSPQARKNSSTKRK